MQSARLGAEPLAVTHDVQAGSATVWLSGELDIATVPLAERALRVAEQADARELVIDLSQVRFIDSTGLRCVLGAHRRATELGRVLKVRRGPAQVQRVFTITRTDKLLDFLD
jgi:anti-anti-sigma factor